jgi:hypothetical protein
MTVRHDAIVRLLAGFFKQLGAAVEIEPRIYNTPRYRPDLDITFTELSKVVHIMLDVGVTNPCAPSRSRRPKAALTAAATMERKKLGDYKAFATERGAVFHPFIMESVGAFGAETGKVMKALADAAWKSRTLETPQAFLTRAYQKLSVALQKGNGVVIRQGAVMTRAAVKSAAREAGHRGSAK